MSTDSLPVVDISPLVQGGGAAAVKARERGGLISPRTDRRTDVYQLSVGGELY